MRRVLLPVLLGVVALALIVTAVAVRDKLTWVLETFWVIVGLPVVVVTWRRFPLTTLLCACSRCTR